MTMRDAVFVAGAGLIVAGVAFIHWPAALILAGAGLLFAAKRMGGAESTAGEVTRDAG